MDSQWQQAVSAYGRLQLRERYMLLSASSLLLLWLGLLYLLEPGWQQLQQQRLQQQQLQTATAQLQRQLTEVETALQQDPDAQLKQQLASASLQQQQLTTQIRQVSGRYIAPEQMVALLQDVLLTQPQVQLLRLKTSRHWRCNYRGPATAVPVSCTSIAPYLCLVVSISRYNNGCSNWNNCHGNCTGGSCDIRSVATRWPNSHLELETVSEQQNYLRL